MGWNDLHGQLEADDPIVDTGRLPAGGVVALADAVDAARSNAGNEPVFVLDAGDLFTGPIASTLAEGKPVIAAYAVLGVDAAAVGNHEFDFGPIGYEKVTAPKGTPDGPNGPRGALLARMEEAPFPFLSANLHGKGGVALPWPKLKPHVVIQRGGFSIGVVGYTTDETPKTTLKPNIDDLDFVTDAAKNVAASVRALRAQGASPVVLIAHASIEGDLPESLDDPSDPKGAKHIGEMARLMDGVGPDKPDLIIAGHRHAWMLGRVRGVPIVSTSQHGVGYSKARFCGSPGKTTLSSLARHVAFASDPPQTPLGAKVATVVAPYLAAVKLQADQVVTQIPHTCLAQHPNGTAFAEMIARAILSQSVETPRIAVMNAGGLRAPLHSGAVHYRDLFASLPFENAVATCTTTRAGMVRALGNISMKISAKERFPFGIAGAKVKAKRESKGVRILDAELDSEKGGPRLADDAKVTIVMPDFLLWGGDGFLDGVVCSATSETQLRLRDAFRVLVAQEKGGCDGPAKNIEIEGE
ncbi:MAG: bifunctional metallophosphatase/5'-nucleotidase [Polyangiales bacterium]